MKRKTILDIQNSQEKLVCLTAYTTPMAKLLDKYCDILLVGDSVAMVLYGLENTLNIDIRTMANHAAAVVRGSKSALVVVDMPFASYQKSPQQAFSNAAKLIKKSSATAIKLEGGIEMFDTVKFLTQRGVAVMGHIGLKPQSINVLGSYSCQGKTKNSQNSIINDAIAIEKAGAFAIVVEGVKSDLADKLVDKVNIPIIGIGASKKCAGQILVTEDMLGVFGSNIPKFVKQYANLDEIITQSVEAYSNEVKKGDFPEKNHCF